VPSVVTVLDVRLTKVREGRHPQINGWVVHGDEFRSMLTVLTIGSFGLANKVNPDI